MVITKTTQSIIKTTQWYYWCRYISPPSNINSVFCLPGVGVSSIGITGCITGRETWLAPEPAAAVMANPPSLHQPTITWNAWEIFWTWKTLEIIGEFCATSRKSHSKQNSVTRCSFWAAKLLENFFCTHGCAPDPAVVAYSAFPDYHYYRYFFVEIAY